VASNKNQHFVPRCYLRPFTTGSANVVINLYNVDRKRFITGAPVKHQCSGDYFYGKDSRLEAAIQALEGAYGNALREILTPSYRLRDEHRCLLRRFWLLQHLRTEQASQRSVEMAHAAEAVSGVDDSGFRLQIKEAVQMAMRTFAECMDIVDDLKVCLVRNRTSVPFVTSDDPAILANRWHQQKRGLSGFSFGLHSAGAIFFLPLSPEVLCLGYDGDVYTVPHNNGWVETRRESDALSVNEHQFLNCRANIFVRDVSQAEAVHLGFARSESRRPRSRYQIHYAVLDRKEGEYSRYRVVDPEEAPEHQEAIIHSQMVHAIPSSWPQLLSWRPSGFVFTNGTGLGYVRRPGPVRSGTPSFRKERLL
jgi:hypothetical protein